MAKKKDIIQKEILFPCGNNLIAQADYGYAFCRQIRHESVDGKDESKFIEECQGCTKGEKITCAACYKDSETGEKKRYKDTFCIGYSQEYLDNKDKPTADYVDMDGSPSGKYTIEVILQCEDYRRVEYFKGNNKNCSMLSLVDIGMGDLLEKNYSKEDELYHLIMFNMETGRVQDIDFESEDEVKDCIISVRLLKEGESYE